MNWESFFLVCFVVGFSFSVLSFLGGLGRFHLHLLLPKHIHLGGLGHGAAPGAGHGGSAPAHAPTHGTAQAHSTHQAAANGGHFPFVNPMTMAAFLTWFGGAGYLLVHLRHIWIFAGLALASLAGLVAAAIVFVFVGKVLIANERDLDPLDYEMVGVLGRISVPIRIDGTGEIIFDQEGVRRTCAARCERNGPLAKGEEVVVTRYERGVAYVRRWEELANPAEASPQDKTKS
jgi:membrane protein implicated in regulation of membrane protease activity